GREVLHDIGITARWWSGRKEMHIVPWLSATCNAAGVPGEDVSPDHDDFVRATPRGRSARNNRGRRMIDHGHTITGTGVGTTVTVQFTPAQGAPGPPPRCLLGPSGDPLPGFRGDEVLLHEMFHGLRMMMGKFLNLRMGERFDSREEFYSIVVL